MKNLIVFLLYFLCSVQLMAQNVSSFDNTSRWVFNFGFCDGCTPQSDHHLFFDGDTVVDGKSHAILSSYIVERRYSDSYLYSQEYQNYKACVDAGACEPINEQELIYTPPSPFLLLRESNDSVFTTTFLGNELNSEQYYYSNNLTNNDSLETTFFNQKVAVDSVGTINIGGQNKTITFLENDLKIIEGFGIVGIDNNINTYSGLAFSFINVSGAYLGPVQCFAFNNANPSVVSGITQDPLIIDPSCFVDYDILMNTKEEYKITNSLFVIEGQNIVAKKDIESLKVYSITGNLLTEVTLQAGAAV